MEIKKICFASMLLMVNVIYEFCIFFSSTKAGNHLFAPHKLFMTLRKALMKIVKAFELIFGLSIVESFSTRPWY